MMQPKEGFISGESWTGLVLKTSLSSVFRTITRKVAAPLLSIQVQGCLYNRRIEEHTLPKSHARFHGDLQTPR